MVELYVTQKLSVNQVAAQLGYSTAIITLELEKHGIKRRRPMEWARKYPELALLKIGESLLVPRPTRKRSYSNFYSMAKWAGIRISIRSAGEAMFELIRVG